MALLDAHAVAAAARVALRVAERGAVRVASARVVCHLWRRQSRATEQGAKRTETHVKEVVASAHAADAALGAVELPLAHVVVEEAALAAGAQGRAEAGCQMRAQTRGANVGLSGARPAGGPLFRTAEHAARREAGRATHAPRVSALR